MIPFLDKIALEELDGKYEVRTETSDGGPYKIDSDGTTEIRQSRTYRKDKNGLVWESTFSDAGRNKFEMKSVCDPSLADEEVYIKDNKNNLTREKVTYTGQFIAKRTNGRIVLQGEIRHGIVTTRLTLKKLA